MPNTFDAIPIDAYAANARLGTRERVSLGGQMHLVRDGGESPSRRAGSIILSYRGGRLARYAPNGALTIFQPPFGRDYAERPRPQRAVLQRIAAILPLGWELETRPPSRRYGPRAPQIVYRGVYRVTLEMDMTFEPNGSIRMGPYPTPLADIEMAVRRMRSTDPHYQPRVPAPVTLPSWVGRGSTTIPEPDPAEGSAARFTGAVAPDIRDWLAAYEGVAASPEPMLFDTLEPEPIPSVTSLRDAANGRFYVRLASLSPVEEDD